MRIPDFELGMTKTVQKTITQEDTALNYGNGALKHMLATPTLAALMIEAAVDMIDINLPDGYITVGKRLNIEHTDPTIEGMTVTVQAKLVSIQNTKLTFEIIAYDELGQIGNGVHDRYIVNYNTIMTNVDERCNIIKNKIS